MRKIRILTAKDGGNAGSAGSSEQWTAKDGGNAGSAGSSEQWTAKDGGNAGSAGSSEQWTIGSAVKQCVWVLFLLFAVSTVVHAANPKTDLLSNDRHAKKISAEILQLTQSTTNALNIGQIQGRASESLLLDIVLETVDAAVIDRITRISDISVRHISEKYRRASVTVFDPFKVFELAKIPEIRSIRRDFGAIAHTGSVDGLADKALAADVIKANHSLNGAGQTVGVLSDSFAGGPNRDSNTSPSAGVAGTLTRSPAQDSGDLPAQITIFEDLAGGSDEGAAMAELVHDIVPAAAIAFNTAFISEASFADGIDQLCKHSTVVVDDILYFAEPMYQTGIVAQAASECVKSGVPYFSSAGNSSNFAVHERFADSNPAVENKNFPVSGEDLHQWETGDEYLEIKLSPGARIIAVMQWNQPFDSVSRGAGAEIDLDMYLTSTAATPTFGGNLLSLAFNAQGDTGAPQGDAVEILSFSNFSVNARKVYLSLDHFQGKQDVIPQSADTPLEFRVVFFTAGVVEIEGITDRTSAFGAASMYGHSLAEGVVSVAAVPFFDAPAFATNDAEFNDPARETARIDPEDFSARGGEQTLQFDRNGRFITKAVFGPVIASVDANNTSFFGVDGRFQDAGLNEPDGIKNFFGTSAAAPNAAAIAALMQQRMPVQTKTRSRANRSSLTATQISAILQHTAIDVTGYRAAEGVDDVTGYGLIDASAALARAVNRAPEFVANFNDISVCKNAGGQAFKLWTSEFSDNDFNTQQLEFIVENDNPDLFGGLLAMGGQPSISVPSGTLYFRGGLNQSGTATVTVRLQDNGGTAKGGQDTSVSQSFKLTINKNCDDGAGELFNPGNLSFDFSQLSNVSESPQTTNLSLKFDSLAALDEAIAAAANVPLNGLDDLSSNTQNRPEQIRSFNLSLLNTGANIGNDVLIRLELAGYESLGKIDPNCSGDINTGIFHCFLKKADPGKTTLNFNYSARHGENLSAIAELSAPNDLEFRDNRAVLGEEGKTSHSAQKQSSGTNGGGAIGRLFLLLLSVIYLLAAPSYNHSTSLSLITD